MSSITVANGHLYRADFPAKLDGEGRVIREAFARVVLIDDSSNNRYRLAEDAEILELCSQNQAYRVFLTDITLELATDQATGLVKEPTPSTKDGTTLLWQTAKVTGVGNVELRDPWQGDTLTKAIKAAVAQRP